MLAGPNGNLTAKTNASGEYRFANLVAGTYTISEVLQGNWSITTPLTVTYSIIINSGFIAEGKNFGDLMA